MALAMKASHLLVPLAAASSAPNAAAGRRGSSLAPRRRTDLHPYRAGFALVTSKHPRAGVGAGGRGCRRAHSLSAVCAGANGGGGGGNASAIERPSAVVIGGGWAGFGAAYQLLKHGFTVTLLDAAESPGGLSSGWRTAQGRAVEAGVKGFW